MSFRRLRLRRASSFPPLLPPQPRLPDGGPKTWTDGAGVRSSVEPAASLVVLRTLPADASVARAIDDARLSEIVGTVSGDDTIFLATFGGGGGAPRAPPELDRPTATPSGLSVGAAAPIEAFLKPAFDECRSDPSAGKRVSIVGATGYAGRARGILSSHPGPSGPIFRRAGASAPSSLHPRLAGRTGPSAELFTVDALGIRRSVSSSWRLHEVSAEVVPRILARLPGVRVIDLSGAFRLREWDYPPWYGFEHPCPELLPEAVYGLTEWCNGELEGARLVANPGCYATSALLALKPIAGMLDPAQPVVCDSKSGVSGAGRGTDLAYSFTELFGNSKAYSAGTHRHQQRSSRISTAAVS
jgi:hypothetical protein